MIKGFTLAELITLTREGYTFNAWDSSSVNCGNGHNDWSSSDISSYLNNYYLPYNLKSTANSMISSGLWNTGTINIVKCGQCMTVLDASIASFYQFFIQF